ncbi:MAG: phosphatase PAP2 family protein [Clostridia bacterium]
MQILSVIGNSFWFGWEVDLIVWLQQANGAFLTFLASALTMFGEELIMIGILGLLYWGLDKKFGEYIGFNLLVAITLNPLAKNIANRRRPYMDNSSIQCLKPVADGDIMDAVTQGFSFPSGHSTGAGALYPSLPFYKKKNWLIVLAIVIPLIVGLTRIYLGVHYPTDVIGGWALGLAVVFLVHLLRKAVKNKYFIYLAMLIVCSAGMFYCRTNDYFTSYGLLLGFVGGIFFEEKITKFENTKIWWRVILRVAVGGGLYLGLNALFKLPVTLFWGEAGKIWLETASAGNFAFRTIRYALVTFIAIGIYPMSFKLFDKLWLKMGLIKKVTATQAVTTENVVTATQETSIKEDNQENTAKQGEINQTQD